MGIWKVYESESGSNGLPLPIFSVSLSLFRPQTCIRCFAGASLKRAIANLEAYRAVKGSKSILGIMTEGIKNNTLNIIMILYKSIMQSYSEHYV